VVRRNERREKTFLVICVESISGEARASLVRIRE